MGVGRVARQVQAMPRVRSIYARISQETALERAAQAIRRINTNPQIHSSPHFLI